MLEKNNHPVKNKYKCLGDNYLDPLKVRFENCGLGTNMYIDIFSNPFQRKVKNRIKKTLSVESPRIMKGTKWDNCWSNYSINNQAVLANQLTGFRPADFKKYFSFLNFKTESFGKLHFYCEDNVGKELLKLSKESMNRKLQEERKLCLKYFNIVPSENSDADKIPIVIKQDMQWPQRGFNSPAGTIHTFGGLSNGIIQTNLLINKCTWCNKYKAETETIESLRHKCESKETPCTTCIKACQAKVKIIHTDTKIKKIIGNCREKYCPADKTCGCKMIGPAKSSITRMKKKIETETDPAKKIEILVQINERKVLLDRLEKQCIQRIHNNKSKCKLVPLLQKEISDLNDFRKLHIESCAKKYSEIKLTTCKSKKQCRVCKKQKDISTKDYMNYQEKSLKCIPA